MIIDCPVKLLIRLLLIAGSFCMMVGNWDQGGYSLIASVFFISANFLALVNNFKGCKNGKKMDKSCKA